MAIELPYTFSQAVPGTDADKMRMNLAAISEEFSSLVIPFQYLGGPLEDFPILRLTFVEIVNFQADLEGCAVTAETPATVDTIFDIKRNTQDFGTMTFLAGQSAADFASVSQIFIVGDVLSIVPRRTDATLAMLSGNLVGS